MKSNYHATPALMHAKWIRECAYENTVPSPPIKKNMTRLWNVEMEGCVIVSGVLDISLANRPKPTEKRQAEIKEHAHAP